MAKFIRIAIGLGLIVLGIWLWRTLFPPPEKVIRSRLADLAATASFAPNEAALDKLAGVRKFAAFFTTDVVVSADVPGRGRQSLEGRDNLTEAFAAVRHGGRGLTVEFLDVNITLGPDKQTAVANLTAKATMPGDTDFSVQEFNFMFRKQDGEWLIYSVETVKTLALAEPHSRSRRAPGPLGPSPLPARAMRCVNVSL